MPELEVKVSGQWYRLGDIHWELGAWKQGGGSFRRGIYVDESVTGNYYQYRVGFWIWNGSWWVYWASGSCYL